ncbi:MAG: hypothetical protein QOF25_232 [Mycobacterium sp.]|nr:hypothetical protein [Mycobacterium sp.]
MHLDVLEDNHYNRHHCLVQLKIAIDTWLLLRFAIYVWTIPARFVQIYLAISVPRATRLDVTP